MDGIRIYARDLVAEVRRAPSVLAVSVALLLLALSASSEMVTDARVAVVSELHDVLAAAGAGSGGRDLPRLRMGFGDTSQDDLQQQ